MRFVVVFFLFSNYSEKITYTLSKGVCFTEEFLLHDQTSQSEHFVTGFVVLFFSLSELRDRRCEFTNIKCT